MIITMRPRNSEKYGREYIRNGTSSIFIAVEFKVMRGGYRSPKQRTLKLKIKYRQIFTTKKLEDKDILSKKCNYLKIYKNEQKLRADK